MSTGMSNFKDLNKSLDFLIKNGQDKKKLQFYTVVQHTQHCQKILI